MVLVNSAGNSNYAYPEQPGTLATATDANGNLILGGRVIIVGSYDINTNSVASYSNRAGNICHTLAANGSCADKYRISDFYILAPGNAFTASKTGDLYNIQTGTSQAAAVVSGSVAVINQMWPYMKGENIVKLLMTTANKNLAGYNPEVHGQGLLDLEKATRPVGTMTIPTTGRTGVVAVNGSFATNTSGGLSSLSSKLSSVVVLDSFGRDYRMNLAQNASAKVARVDFNPITKANYFSDYNPYSRLNTYTYSGSARTGDYDVKADLNGYTNGAQFEMGKTTKYSDNTNVRLGMGFLTEHNAWMGNSVGGMFGEVGQSYTQFFNFTGNHRLNKNVTVFGSAWVGQTTADMTSTGLVTNIGSTQSYSWNVGADYTHEGHSFGATVSQPVTVYKGSVDVTLPVAMSAEGVVQYSKERVSISPDVHEYDFGAYYKYKTASLGLIAYGEHQVNYLNQAGVTNNLVGLALNKEW